MRLREGPENLKLLDLAPRPLQHVAQAAGLFGVERPFSHLGEQRAAEVADRLADRLLADRRRRLVELGLDRVEFGALSASQAFPASVTVKRRRGPWYDEMTRPASESCCRIG